MTQAVPQALQLPKMPRLSRRKRWCFRLIVVLGIWTFVEFACLCALIFWHGSLSELHRQLDGTAVTKPAANYLEPPEDILHPYTGWARRPREGLDPIAGIPTVNQFGFAGVELPLKSRSPDKVLVGILGGSVAEELSTYGQETLRRVLASDAKFHGKDIEIVRLSLSGYKQPQQLLLINYLLSLGADFDVLINIDGFNEIALPAVENVPNRVFAAFPRSWHLRMAGASDIEELRFIGEIAVLKHSSQRWAQAISAKPWRWFPSLCLLWHVVNERTQASVNDCHNRLGAFLAEQSRPWVNGPIEQFEDSMALYRHCTEVWKRSSLVLHRICEQSGIRYFHFLQPNQYLPLAKPLSEEEKHIAWEDDYPGRLHIEAGYPLLRESGVELSRHGVRFFDLTQLFHSDQETRYRDNCCHFNQSGYDHLANKIAQSIISAK